MGKPPMLLKTSSNIERDSGAGIGLFWLVLGKEFMKGKDKSV